MAAFELTPGSLDLKIVQGDDWSMTANFSGDRSAYAFAASIEPRPGGNSTTITCSVGAHSGGSTPVTFSLTDTQTDALTPGPYVWAARWTTGSTQRTVLAGAVEVLAEVVG